jgi:antitoxin (DNA-binding transcriptional repressor) of toxin-antitoxin stability system
MTTIAIEEIGRDPDGWLRRVEAGESLLVMRGDSPLAEIKPMKAPGRKPRPIGLCAGEFVVPDDFDDLLPENVLRAFEGR